jgi:hypothetical protein
MTRGRLVVLTIALFLALELAGPAASGTNSISVTDDRTAISTSLGHKFFLRSTIANRGTSAASGLIAHLNVLSLRNGVYIDPEDWSSHRTRYLAPIPPGGSVTIDWKLQAVNAGSIGIYVAVLPQSGSPQPPVTGPTVHVSIAEHKTLNSGGILPLALGIPALLGALSLGLRFRRRSQALPVS